MIERINFLQLIKEQKQKEKRLKDALLLNEGYRLVTAQTTK